MRLTLATRRPTGLRQQHLAAILLFLVLVLHLSTPMVQVVTAQEFPVDFVCPLLPLPHWQMLNPIATSVLDMAGNHIQVPRVNHSVIHYMGLDLLSRSSYGLTTSVSAMLGHPLAYISSPLHQLVLWYTSNNTAAFAASRLDHRYDAAHVTFIEQHLGASETRPLEPMHYPMPLAYWTCFPAIPVGMVSLTAFMIDAFMSGYAGASYAVPAADNSQWAPVDVIVTSPYVGITSFYHIDSILTRIDSNQSMDVIPFIRDRTHDSTTRPLFPLQSAPDRVGITLTPMYLKPESILGYDVRATARQGKVFDTTTGLAPSWPIELALRLVTSTAAPGLTTVTTPYVALFGGATVAGVDAAGIPVDPVYCIDQSPLDDLFYTCTRDYANPVPTGGLAADINDRVPRYPELTAVRAIAIGVAYSCPRDTSDTLVSDEGREQLTLLRNEREDAAVDILRHHTIVTANGAPDVEAWLIASALAKSQRATQPEIHQLIIAASPRQLRHDAVPMGMAWETAQELEADYAEAAVTCILYAGVPPDPPANVVAWTGIDPLALGAPRLIVSFDSPNAAAAGSDGGAPVRNYTWSWSIVYSSSPEAATTITTQLEAQRRIWPVAWISELDSHLNPTRTIRWQLGMVAPSFVKGSGHRVNISVTLVAASVWGASSPSVASPVISIAALPSVCDVANGGCDPLRHCSTAGTSDQAMCSDCPSGYITTNGVNCVNPCANNGGCDPLSVCVSSTAVGNRTCAPCPFAYTTVPDAADATKFTCRSVCFENGGCHPLRNCSAIPNTHDRVCATCPQGYLNSSAAGTTSGDTSCIVDPLACPLVHCIHGTCHIGNNNTIGSTNSTHCICPIGWQGVQCSIVADIRIDDNDQGAPEMVVGITAACAVFSDALGQRLARRDFRRSSRRFLIALNAVSIVLVIPLMIIFQWSLPTAVTSALDDSDHGHDDGTDDGSQGPWTAMAAMSHHPVLIFAGLVLAMIQLATVALYQHPSGLLLLAPAAILAQVLYMAINSIEIDSHRLSHAQAGSALAMALFAALLTSLRCYCTSATDDNGVAITNGRGWRARLCPCIIIGSGGWQRAAMTEDRADDLDHSETSTGAVTAANGGGVEMIGRVASPARATRGGSGRSTATTPGGNYRRGPVTAGGGAAVIRSSVPGGDRNSDDEDVGPVSSRTEGRATSVPRIRGTSFLDEDENEQEEARATGVDNSAALAAAAAASSSDSSAVVGSSEEKSPVTMHATATAVKQSHNGSSNKHHQDDHALQASSSAPSSQSKSSSSKNSSDLLVTIDDGGPESVFPTEFSDVDSPLGGSGAATRANSLPAFPDTSSVVTTGLPSSTDDDHLHADLPEPPAANASASMVFFILCVAGTMWIWVQQKANERYHYSSWTMSSFDVIITAIYVSIWQWCWSCVAPQSSTPYLSSIRDMVVASDDRPFSCRSSLYRVIGDLSQHRAQLGMVVGVRIFQIIYALGVWHLTLRYGRRLHTVTDDVTMDDGGTGAATLIWQFGIARLVLSWLWCAGVWYFAPKFIALTTDETAALFTRSDLLLKVASSMTVVIAMVLITRSHSELQYE